MTFEDYGIVDWFDPSKGFGVVKSAHNADVFIHKNNNIIGNVIKDCFVFIKVVIKNKTNDGNEGKFISVWQSDRNSFCEKIYKHWHAKQVMLYDGNIKWLLKYGAEDVVKKIIDRNWLNNADFIFDFDNLSLHIKNMTYDFILNKIVSKDHGDFIQNPNALTMLKNVHLLNKENAGILNIFGMVNNRREIGTEYYNNSKIISRFLFDIWLSKNTMEFDDDIKWLLLNGTEDILLEMIKFKELLINNDFANEIRSNDFRRPYPGREIFDQILFKIWLSKESVEYDEDLAWLLNNRTDKYLLKILEYKNLAKNTNFIKDLIKLKCSHYYQVIAQFLLDICSSKKMKNCKGEIEWIIKNGTTKIFKNFIFLMECSSNCKEDFAVFLRKFTRIKNYFHDEFRACEGIMVPSDKLDIIADFLFQIWDSEKTMKCNENVKWLIDNANNTLLNRLISSNEQNWLKDSVFIKYIIESNYSYDYYHSDYSSDDFNANIILKEDFLLKVYELDEVYEWLVKYSSFDSFKKLLSIKLQYPPVLLETIFSALFPNNNIAYFEQKANQSSWSDRFSEKYIVEGKTKRINAFRKLFSDELNLLKTGILKKQIIKKTTHAATDLASFSFCPASYAINQVYDIDIREQENVFIGTREHERQRLLGLSDRDMLNAKRQEIEGRTFESDFFERIMNAECISQGHNDAKATVHYSAKKKIAGIPDYIFKDKNGNFAVEEKYIFKEYNDFTPFYDNHKIQALAYLFGLSKFNFQEVYVVYWFVKKSNEEDGVSVYNYKLFELKRTDRHLKELIKVFNHVEDLQNRNPYEFSIEMINYNKCVKCSYFPYCEYKKGNIPVIELPALPEAPLA